MKLYIYTNSKTKELLFETYTSDILIADQQFEMALKYSPSKNPFIGCEIIPQPQSEDVGCTAP
jgi:hypothetical protein